MCVCVDTVLLLPLNVMNFIKGFYFFMNQSYIVIVLYSIHTQNFYYPYNYILYIILNLFYIITAFRTFTFNLK